MRKGYVSRKVRVSVIITAKTVEVPRKSLLHERPQLNEMLTHSDLKSVRVFTSYDLEPVYLFITFFDTFCHVTQH